MLKWTLSIVATQTLILLHIYTYAVLSILLHAMSHCVTYSVHTGHQALYKPAQLFFKKICLQKLYTNKSLSPFSLTDMMLHITTGPSQSVPSPSSNYNPPPSTGSPAISASPGMLHHLYKVASLFKVWISGVLGSTVLNSC